MASLFLGSGGGALASAGMGAGTTSAVSSTGAPSAAAAGPAQASFSPYVDNGGTALAVAGKTFCVVAADSRLSTGYSIWSRSSPKYVKLTDKTVLVTSGMQSDMLTLHKTLQARLSAYKHQNGKPMSTPAIAQMLSNTLYYRRFFPYYTFNLLAGVDEAGVGAVYSYDAIGSFERVWYSATGSGHGLVQPLLDNQLGHKHSYDTRPEREDLTSEQTVTLVRDAFTSAGERDIYTGDSIDVFVIDADGVHQSNFPLKKD